MRRLLFCLAILLSAATARAGWHYNFYKSYGGYQWFERINDLGVGDGQAYYWNGCYYVCAGPIPAAAVTLNVDSPTFEQDALRGALEKQKREDHWNWMVGMGLASPQQAQAAMRSYGYATTYAGLTTTTAGFNPPGSTPYGYAGLPSAIGQPSDTLAHDFMMKSFENAALGQQLLSGVGNMVSTHDQANGVVDRLHAYSDIANSAIAAAAAAENPPVTTTTQTSGSSVPMVPQQGLNPAPTPQPPAPAPGAGQPPQAAPGNVPPNPTPDKGSDNILKLKAVVGWQQLTTNCLKCHSGPAAQAGIHLEQAAVAAMDPGARLQLAQAVQRAMHSPAERQKFYPGLAAADLNKPQMPKDAQPLTAENQSYIALGSGRRNTRFLQPRGATWFVLLRCS